MGGGEARSLPQAQPGPQPDLQQDQKRRQKVLTAGDRIRPESEPVKPRLQERTGLPAPNGWRVVVACGPAPYAFAGLIGRSLARESSRKGDRPPG